MNLKIIRKRCCWLLIIIPTLLCIRILFIWVFDVYMPSKHSENALEATNKNSKTVASITEDGFLSYLHQYRLTKKEEPKKLCEVFWPTGEVTHQICVNMASSTMTVLFVDITDKVFGQFKKLKLNVGTVATTEHYSSIAFSDNKIFVVWINERRTYSIYLTVLDRSSGNELKTMKLYEKDFSINNISVGYHEKNDELLIAWNDWSYPDDEDLFLGKLDAKNLLNGKLNFSISQILQKDKWDKRNPYFIKDGSDLYLAHSTGDHWGLFAHTGTRGIGVSKIGDSSSPEEYRMIASSNPLPRIQKIESGVIYYEKQASKISKIEEVRKIPFDNAYKPFSL